MTIFQAALFAIEQLFEKEYKPVPIFVSNHENKMCGNFYDYSYRQACTPSIDTYNYWYQMFYFNDSTRCSWKD